MNICNHVEEKVNWTIREYGLILPGEKVAVAVSGGKDSMTMLHLLRKYDIKAIVVDEGIRGYRAKTIENAKKYCRRHDIELVVVSFKQEYGKGLDDIEKKNPCTECGKRRRQLLNKHAVGCDKLAVGHNLDDTSQTILMNLFKCTMNMQDRAMPMSDKSKYVQRIKPLYWLLEEEIRAYARHKGLEPEDAGCPYRQTSFRKDVKDALDRYDKSVKENIVKKYLSMQTIKKTKRN